MTSTPPVNSGEQHTEHVLPEEPPETESNTLGTGSLIAAGCIVTSIVLILLAIVIGALT